MFDFSSIAVGDIIALQLGGFIAYVATLMVLLLDGLPYKGISRPRSSDGRVVRFLIVTLIVLVVIAYFLGGLAGVGISAAAGVVIGVSVVALMVLTHP
jgi:hypothetical protein